MPSFSLILTTSSQRCASSSLLIDGVKGPLGALFFWRKPETGVPRELGEVIELAESALARSGTSVVVLVLAEPATPFCVGDAAIGNATGCVAERFFSTSLFELLAA